MFLSSADLSEVIVAKVKVAAAELDVHQNTEMNLNKYSGAIRELFIRRKS